MDCDSTSSCEGRLRDLDDSENRPRLRESQRVEHSTDCLDSAPWHSIQVVSSQPKIKLGGTNRSLSSQVMEYYQKYSQSSNLDQYFSLPASGAPAKAVKYYYSIYELNPKSGVSRQDCIGEEYNLRPCVPRERRRCVRPPLIEQSSSTEESSRYVQPLIDPQSPSPDFKRTTPETIPEERNESHETLPDNTERKLSSPTSSIASHKPLEWDSGADVGYFNTLPHNKQHEKKLSTIERMALARGCSAALRLDPEGTTESGISGRLIITQRNTKLSMVPDANSTPLVGNASGSESEIEITPIMKNHLPGTITGNDIKSNERSIFKDLQQQDTMRRSLKQDIHAQEDRDTPKSTHTFKMPFVKYPTEGKKVSSRQNMNKENLCPPTSPLKKSTSMNMLVLPPSKLMLKRSQSDLNLHARDKNKAGLPLIFNSTSSIATVVNKPATCDKVIQTSLNVYTQESIGVQVSVLEEEKPPLPKRGTSLQKSLHSILKNPKGTYKVQNLKNQASYETYNSNAGECTKETTTRRSSSEVSQNGSARQTPQPEDAENITGRANSFEYFPGHIYENVPNGSGSHVSSSDTVRSNSTLPNTSSSINEKLWGDSDSLVRDLERSVNILKSLVDANKCDKEVKKRLIHHVIKRLVTAKYTDDKIEHNLEDNVPWNPDDARNKVYRAEILQALTKKHSTTDSSDDWNTQKKNTCVRKPMGASRSIMKEVALESSNSEKFEKNTDRTETDGRKARMGLRAEDCHQSSNSASDPEKSESSECFFPQRNRKSNKVQDIFGLKEKCKIPREDSTTTNSTPPDHNRMLLDAVVNNRRTAVPSSNNTEEHIDWRLLTTLSERQFELKKCSNSDSADSKLVSYAEMEKRNQLIWITNEISHLCNLKKLLEQPRKPERSRMSPRKSKSANFKSKPVSMLTRIHDPTKQVDYMHRNTSDVQGNSAEEPWSSHCNLATCQPTTSTTNSVIQRIRKRNSCAQTATNVTGAHSKTGGEIVSASNIPSATIKLVNTGVQTVPQEIPAIPTLIQSEIVHYIKCPAHKTLMHFQNSCKCNDQTCQCQKHAIQNLVTACVHCLQEQGQSQSVGNRMQKMHGNVEYFQEDRPVISQTPLNQTNGSSLNSSDIIHHCASREGSQFKQKETKNQINASKSKYTCDCKTGHACQCVNDCRCTVNGNEDNGTEYKRLLPKACQLCSTQIAGMEATNAITKCEECQKKVFRTHEKREVSAGKKCTCTNVCDCDNDRYDSKKGCAPGRSTSKYHQSSNGYAAGVSHKDGTKLSDCSTDCSCENVEVHSTKVFCDYHSAGKAHHNEIRHHGLCPKTEDRQTQARPYCTASVQTGENTHQHKVQNGLKCNCEKDCSCSNNVKNVEEKSHNRGYSGKASYVDETGKAADSERNCKYCRSCGTNYQNARKCSCHQVYPKAVAYELSFTRDSDQKNENLDVLPKVPLSNLPSSGGKPEGCACDTTKRVNSNKNSQHINTLQDYLSKNKPEFVGNAETRRQYMSEISHLRQLRKEKRIQLLAMASTSSVVKSPKVSSKATVCVQKKMTDAEMKERLRKRYLRLNEVRFKRRQQERQEETRHNKLMAKIFCKKLQQKVLRGQVDLSQSVSVISNM